MGGGLELSLLAKSSPYTLLSKHKIVKLTYRAFLRKHIIVQFYPSTYLAAYLIGHLVGSSVYKRNSFGSVVIIYVSVPCSRISFPFLNFNQSGMDRNLHIIVPAKI